MPSHVTHLESTLDGSSHRADRPQQVHMGKPFLVRYDLDGVARTTTRGDVLARPATMWRWRELLPLPTEHAPVSLGENETPLLDCPRLAGRLGLQRLRVKDESRLPGGSFKSRGMAMAVSMAHAFGIRKVAVPTAGNAGGALAAYAARAGIECHVFMPRDTPAVNRLEAIAHGAHVTLVDGLIHECGRIVRERQAAEEWFDISTLREPYRIEGKKTMGLELAEQCDFVLPDAIYYPTGGGTGLIGMWKAFAELDELGWLDDEKKPRMVACQSDGCAPIVEAWTQGLPHGVELEDPFTVASGLRVPKALGDFLVLDACRESGGHAAAAAEDGLAGWMHEAMRLEGLPLCPETAACLAVLEADVREGRVAADADVVVFNTGAAQKYVEVLEALVASLA